MCVRLPGLQTATIEPAKPYGLPLGVSTLADELRALGYRTAGFGKWHLGYCRAAYLPTARGFDAYFGFWNGAEHYSNHTRDPTLCPANFSAGLDYWNGTAASGTAPVRDHDGTYSAVDLAAAAAAAVAAADVATPLFTWVAFQVISQSRAA